MLCKKIEELKLKGKYPISNSAEQSLNAHIDRKDDFADCEL